MRRIESRRDCVFGVGFGTRHGDRVIGNEEGGDVREGGVAVAEEVDEREAELRGLLCGEERLIRWWWLVKQKEIYVR